MRPTDILMNEKYCMATDYHGPHVRKMVETHLLRRGWSES